MQEVIPKVVAMAVSIVMMMWSILLQVFLFSMMFVFFLFFLPQRTRSLTEFLFYHPHGKLKRTPWNSVYFVVSKISSGWRA